MSPTNHYAHIDYRKMIAWPKRLEREWTFLSSAVRLAAVEAAARPRLRHRRARALLRGEGLRGRRRRRLGHDARAGARKTAFRPASSSCAATCSTSRSVVTGTFGGAVCLGNTLAHIMDQDTLTQLLQGRARRAAAGRAARHPGAQLRAPRAHRPAVPAAHLHPGRRGRGDLPARDDAPRRRAASRSRRRCCATARTATRRSR